MRFIGCRAVSQSHHLASLTTGHWYAAVFLPIQPGYPPETLQSSMAPKCPNKRLNTLNIISGCARAPACDH